MNKPILLFIGLLGLLASPLAIVLSIGFIPKTITANSQFPVVTIGGIPQIDASKWTLSVGGDVEHDLTFTYAEITAMPNVTETVTMQCVDGPSATATWTGVPLNKVLAQAGVKNDSKSIVFLAADGYNSSIACPTENQSDVLLAWGMNGALLPADQGYPLRLVVPNNYGYKWVMWITNIVLVNYVFYGYWESQGWSNNAQITTVTGWQLHAVLFSTIFMVGGLVAISGKMLAPKSTAFQGLPAFMGRRRFHVATSLVFFPAMALTFTYWTISTYIARAAIFTTVHGVVGLISMGLVAVGSILGLLAIHNPSKHREWHGRLAMLGIYAFLLTMLLGIATAAGINLFAGL